MFMRKSIYVCLSSLIFLLSLISCGDIGVNNTVSYEQFVETRQVLFADEISELRNELIFYSLTENYKLNKESVQNDLSSFMALKLMEDSDNDFSRAIDIAENRYDIKELRTFKKTLSTNKVLIRGVDTSDEINFSVYDISDKENGTSGIAITSDDERIGSLLCILDDVDCIDEDEDPVLNIFLSNLDRYIEEVSNELESITEDDLEYFKEKYNITDEEIVQAKLEYENSVASRKFWGYDQWSSWSVNDINLNNLSSKTKWGQGDPYNSAIAVMEGIGILLDVVQLL